MTEYTAKLLGDDFPLKPRGEIEIKGGVKVQAFLYTPGTESATELMKLKFPPHSTSTKSVVSIVSESPSVQSWRRIVAGVDDATRE